jgi:cellulose biosynthesis protein BcsQ
MTPAAPGTIVTFYSYKGGSGRTMLLANVAWILASAGKRVLAIDWDLEAPGLHRYFQPFLGDKDCSQSEGVIDLVINYAEAAITPGDTRRDWYRSYADILRYAVSLDWKFPSSGTLDFMPAGRQDAHYSTKVNMFNWATFYDRLGGGAFLEAVKQRFRQDYDYVLIDGRTGVSDTAGIVTMQMPDRIVACFTYTRQSVHGMASVLELIRMQRAQLEQPIHVFPVAMRVEVGGGPKVQEFRDAAMARMRPLISMSPEVFERYWLEVENVYIPAYAYEEQMTIFAENRSALTSALSLTSYLTDGEIRELSQASTDLPRRMPERFTE